MMDLEDFILYALVASGVGMTSKALEMAGKTKIAKTLDIAFFGGSIALLIKEADGIAKEVSKYL